MSGSVIVAGARTPMGRLLGGRSRASPARSSAGSRSRRRWSGPGVAADQVEYVIMGQVLTAGAGQIPARQAAVAAGIPMDVPALTINKVCLSGLDAIALADQLIRAGEFDIVVAGGQESMTQAPHLLAKSREGFKYGDVTMLDHMAYDGLFCAFDQVAMGASTEKYNARYELTREEQDEFAARSHQRAAAAVGERAVRRGDRPGARSRSARATRSSSPPTRASAATPPPRASASCAPRSPPTARSPRARVADLRRRRGRGRDEQGQGRGAGADLARRDRRARRGRRAGRQPARAAGQRDRRGVRQGGHRRRPTSTSSRSTRRSRPSGIVSTRKLGIDPEKVNVNGGAIALGPPDRHVRGPDRAAPRAGAQRRGGGVGAAALCGGGGQGDALILRVPAAS